MNDIEIQILRKEVAQLRKELDYLYRFLGNFVDLTGNEIDNNKNDISGISKEYKDIIPYTVGEDGKFVVKTGCNANWWTNGFWGGFRKEQNIILNMRQKYIL